MLMQHQKVYVAYKPITLGMLSDHLTWLKHTNYVSYNCLLLNCFEPLTQLATTHFSQEYTTLMWLSETDTQASDIDDKV